MVGSSSSALAQASLAAWQEHILEQRRAGAIARMQHQLSMLQAKQESAARKALSTMLASHGSALARAAMTAWQEQIHELRNVRAIDNMQNQMRKLQVQRESAACKALTTMLGSQVSALARVAMTAWQEQIHELRNARTVEKMQNQLRMLQKR